MHVLSSLLLTEIVVSYHRKAGDCMQIGISSSCLYPMQVEDAFRTVGELGAKTAEIFFNSYCELKKPLLSEIKSIKDYSFLAGMKEGLMTELSFTKTTSKQQTSLVQKWLSCTEEEFILKLPPKSMHKVTFRFTRRHFAKDFTSRTRMCIITIAEILSL